MDGRAWQATVLGVAKSQTRLSDSTFIFQVSCVHMVIFIDYTIFKFVKNNAHFFLYVQYILVYFICRRLYFFKKKSFYFVLGYNINNVMIVSGEQRRGLDILTHLSRLPFHLDCSITLIRV